MPLKSALLVDHVKVRKLLLLYILRNQIVYNLQGTCYWSKIYLLTLITTAYMSYLLSSSMFSLNSFPTGGLTTLSNVQRTHENPNGWERNQYASMQ